MSVNIAARQLQQSNFISNLKILLDEFPDVATSQLEFEILETAALDDVQQVNKTLQQCEQLSIKVALDDFGTGYSSLSYLKQLPAQTIKIDQSFVRDILVDPNDMVIVESVLQMAKSFKRTPIAEGVESNQHGSLLLMLGCELGQGYAIGRPMPAKDIPEWMASYQIPDEWRNTNFSHLDHQDISLCHLAVEHNKSVATILNAVKHNAPSLLPVDCFDSKTCSLGQWISGSGYKLYGQLPEFQNIIKEHKKVHIISAKLSGLLDSGDEEHIDAITSELIEHRNNIFAALKNLQ